MSKQVLSRTPTELRHIERSVVLEEVNNQNLLNSDLGSQKSINIPIYFITEVQQRDGQDSQILNSDTCCGLAFTSAQCKIETEKNSDVGRLLNYDDDDYSQGYGQTKGFFRALTKDDFFKPYITVDDFRSSSIKADDVGYNLYVFDKRYQQNLTTGQPIK